MSDCSLGGIYLPFLYQRFLFRFFYRVSTNIFRRSLRIDSAGEDSFCQGFNANPFGRTVSADISSIFSTCTREAYPVPILPTAKHAVDTAV